MSYRRIFYHLLNTKPPAATVTNHQFIHNRFHSIMKNSNCHLNAGNGSSALLKALASTQSHSIEHKFLPYADIPTVAEEHVDLSFFQKLRATFLSKPSDPWNKLHEQIDEKHRRLGPIFRQQLGPIEAIFVMSPDIIREVFLYEGKYPRHPLPEAWTYYNTLHNCKRGLIFMDNEEWLENRKLIAPLMLRNDIRFMNAINQSTDELITDWKQQCNANTTDEYCEIDNILSCLYMWSIKVIIGVMFGKDSVRLFSEIKPTIEDFAKIVRDVFEDTLPLMTTSPQQAHKSNLDIWRKFEHSVGTSIKLANDIFDFGTRKNIEKEDGLLVDLKKRNVSIDIMKCLFVDLIMAAGDTTAYSTQYALYLLSQNPEIQQSIRQQIISSDNESDTPLVRGTVREALRLFPVATFVGRILGKDGILGGYKVNKDTLVLISMYSAGRDEASFPNATEFQPWRWNRDKNGHLFNVNYPQSTIPYALGARNCVGQKIANNQMYAILKKILQNFSVQLVNQKPVEFEMRLIIMPKETLRFGIKRLLN